MVERLLQERCGRQLSSCVRMNTRLAGAEFELNCGKKPSSKRSTDQRERGHVSGMFDREDVDLDLDLKYHLQTCTCSCNHMGFGNYMDYYQKHRGRSWTTADDDEYLLKQSVVQPPSVEHTLPIRIGLSAKDAVWQQVPETKSELYVYSAHLDTRNESVGPLIRIIGTAKSRDPDEVWCRLWYAADGSKTVSAHVTVIREHRHIEDTAVFVFCKLPPLHDKRYPSSVSVVARVKDPINNELTILIPDTTGGFASELEICVKPFHGDYDMKMRFMEFVELNRLLGVEHFTFYNGSVGPNLQCVLNQYVDNSLIQVLPWYLVDPVPGEAVGTQGEFAALNDCLYRNMYKARYVAFLDVEEFIVPKLHDTLLKLIESYEPRSNLSSSSSSSSSSSPSPAAYLFRHASFCMEWPDDKISAALEPNRTESEVVVLRKTLRKTAIHEPGVSSKFICDPRRTIEVGKNFVRQYVDEEKDAALNVPAEVALLHHYRNCSGPRSYHRAIDFVADRTVYTYKDELVGGITKTRDHLDEKCVETARVRTKNYGSNTAWQVSEVQPEKTSATDSLDREKDESVDTIEPQSQILRFHKIVYSRPIGMNVTKPYKSGVTQRN